MGQQPDIGLGVSGLKAIGCTLLTLNATPGDVLVDQLGCLGS